MNPEEKDTYTQIIDRITGGKPTYSLEDAMPYKDMQKFNQDIASDRLESRRRAASSQRKASQIILNA